MEREEEERWEVRSLLLKEGPSKKFHTIEKRGSKRLLLLLIDIVV
jgi:hypothetical protein